MREIPLTKGYVTRVDDDVYEWAVQQRWHAAAAGYAVRKVANGTKRGGGNVFLHRLIAEAPPHLSVDHINGDPTDNRRANLRLCTHAENLKNLRRCRRNTSGFKGVSWSRDRGNWYAYIAPAGRSISLGRYATAEEAARAYDAAALVHFGPFARLNFDPKAPQGLNPDGGRP